jgi:hypothetical protein
MQRDMEEEEVVLRQSHLVVGQEEEELMENYMMTLRCQCLLRLLRIYKKRK